MLNDNLSALAPRPIRYIGAFAFQRINPKPWLMALSVFSVHVPNSGGFSLVLGAAVRFGPINLPIISVWALGGARLRHLPIDRQRVNCST
ncbi:MAG: hypothetical protein B7Z79_11800, partial [Thiomonas sp. 20-64-9]